MQHDRCPACDRPFALVGRVHRCVPRSGSETEVMQGRAARSARVAHNHEVGGSNPPPATNFQMEGDPAGTQAIGAYKSAMGVTPPSTGDGEHLHLSANRGEPAPLSNVIQIRKPKRDRAKYMRDYRARKKAGGAA